MPKIEWGALPDEGRVWVFAADRELSGAEAATVLAAVDGFLEDWKAHGVPLRCARDWREGRFLAVGVDQSAEASGCSIDGLFRVFKEIGPRLEVSLFPRGLVFWRDNAGLVRSSTRSEFKKLVSSGELGQETTVFDTALTSVEAWRTGFEKAVG